MGTTVGIGVGKIIRGDSIEQDLIIKAGGVAMNLTGATIKFSMKKDYNSSVFIINETLTITDALTGTCHLSIDKSITEHFELRKYYYDIEVTDSIGKRYTPIKGQLEVIYDIS